MAAHGNQVNEASRTGPDWAGVEAAYRAGKLSIREIGTMHGISHTAVRKRAIAGGWVRTREVAKSIATEVNGEVTNGAGLGSTTVSAKAGAAGAAETPLEDLETDVRIDLPQRLAVGLSISQREAILAIPVPEADAYPGFGDRIIDLK